MKQPLAYNTDGGGRKPRYFYGWNIVGAAFLTQLAYAGYFSSLLGFYIKPIHDEFGWSRAASSAAIAINIALFGLIGPFAASAMNRWGLRRLILAAIALRDTPEHRNLRAEAPAAGRVAEKRNWLVPHIWLTFAAFFFFGFVTSTSSTMPRPRSQSPYQLGVASTIRLAGQARRTPRSAAMPVAASPSPSARSTRTVPDVTARMAPAPA